MTIKKIIAITGICVVALLLGSPLFLSRAESPQPTSTSVTQTQPEQIKQRPPQVRVPTAAPNQQANPKTAKPSDAMDRWTYFRGNALSQGVANTTLPKKPVLLWKPKKTILLPLKKAQEEWRVLTKEDFVSFI